jgi:hypothetical protein
MRQDLDLIAKRFERGVIVTKQPSECTDPNQTHQAAAQHPTEDANKEAPKDERQESH